MSPKETPILFNSAMVMAILEGRKTQTRRIAKINSAGRVQYKGKNWHVDDPNAIMACPLGQVDDRLWVRETSMAWWNTSDSSFSHVAAFKADGYQLEPGERWVPSIHMPRAASRITLEITQVRLQCLHEIRDCDCVAEGVGDHLEFAKSKFQNLWNQIYQNWDANPYVWVVEYRLLELQK